MEYVIAKMEYICQVEMHKFILGNVQKSQHKQNKDTNIKKRKTIVDQFFLGEYMVKGNKPNKNNNLETSCKGLYLLGGIYRPFIMKHDFMRTTTM